MVQYTYLICMGLVPSILSGKFTCTSKMSWLEIFACSKRGFSGNCLSKRKVLTKSLIEPKPYAVMKQQCNALNCSAMKAVCIISHGTWMTRGGRRRGRGASHLYEPAVVGTAARKSVQMYFNKNNPSFTKYVLSIIFRDGITRIELLYNESAELNLVELMWYI